jgi:hypothetical protein
VGRQGGQVGAHRDADRLSAVEGSMAIQMIRMYREEPAHPGGPTTADVPP